MGNVNAAAIWTPDEGDNLDPEVWSQAMADSIMNGIGERLNRQELPVGLKASIETGTRVKSDSGTIAPYEILANGTGCFVSNIEFTGGVATIPIAGMYFITAASALNPWGTGAIISPENEGRSMALQIKRNGSDIGGSEVEASPRMWQSAQANTVVLCVPGDNIWVEWYSAEPSGTHPDPTSGGMISVNPALHSFSIVLITPVEA